MNSLEAVGYIETKAKAIWTKYQQIVDCGALPKLCYPTKATRYAGFAYYSGKIDFNLAYFCTHTNLEDLEQIIAHELAHIVQYRCYSYAKQAHGPEFRALLELAGYKTDTYHYMSVAKAKSAAKSIKDEIILLSL